MTENKEKKKEQEHMKKPAGSYLCQVLKERKERYHQMYRTRLQRVYRNHNPHKLKNDFVDGKIKKYGHNAEKLHALYEKVCAKYKVTSHGLYDGQNDIESEGDERPEIGFRFASGCFESVPLSTLSLFGSLGNVDGVDASAFAKASCTKTTNSHDGLSSLFSNLKTTTSSTNQSPASSLPMHSISADDENKQKFMERKQRCHKMYRMRLKRVYRNHHFGQWNDDWINKKVEESGRWGVDKIHALYVAECAKYQVIPHGLYDGEKDIVFGGFEVDEQSVESALGTLLNGWRSHNVNKGKVGKARSTTTNNSPSDTLKPIKSSCNQSPAISPAHSSGTSTKTESSDTKKSTLDTKDIAFIPYEECNTIYGKTIYYQHIGMTSHFRKKALGRISQDELRFEDRYHFHSDPARRNPIQSTTFSSNTDQKTPMVPNDLCISSGRDTKTKTPETEVIGRFDIQALCEWERDSKTQEEDELKDISDAASIEFHRNKKTAKISLICTDQNSNAVLLSHVVPNPKEAQVDHSDLRDSVYWRAADSIYSTRTQHEFCCVFEDEKTASKFENMLRAASTNNMKDKGTPLVRKLAVTKQNHAKVQQVDQFDIQHLYELGHDWETRAGASTITFRKNIGKTKIICTENSSNVVQLYHTVPEPEDADITHQSKSKFVYWLALDSFIGSGDATKWRYVGCSFDDEKAADAFEGVLKSASANNKKISSQSNPTETSKPSKNNRQTLTKNTRSKKESDNSKSTKNSRGVIAQFEIESIDEYEKDDEKREKKWKRRAKASSVEFLQNRRTGQIRVTGTEKSSELVIFNHYVPIPQHAAVQHDVVTNDTFVYWRVLDSLKWRNFGCTLRDKKTAVQFADMLRSASINNMEDKSSPPDPKPKPVEIKWHHQKTLKKYIVSQSRSEITGDDDDQKYNDLQLIVMEEDSDDYKLIYSQFMRSAKKKKKDLKEIVVYKIEKEARIVAHESKKKQILQSLGGDVSKLNEFGLYHGTQLKTLPLILHQGFLRQFVSRAAFGRGTYFARDAKYSCNPTYSLPDKDGFQHILLCNVICGEWAKGDHTMKVAPTKKGSDYLPHETTVDDVDHPSIFVTYQDDQALPTHLISFKS